MTKSITDLPFDILYIIFALCWEKRTEPRLPFPVVASHVCRKWRQHVLETPSFWGVINIRDTRPQLEKYRTWLERSRESPLTIVIGGEPFWQRSVKNIKGIMQLLLPHSNRWMSLNIWFCPRKIIRVIFDRLLDVPTPSLTELQVMPDHEIIRRPIAAETRWRFRPFLRGGAPNLRTIAIDRLPYEYIDGRFPGLTVLEITDLKIAVERPSAVAVEIQNLLSRLPNLQVLRLESEYSRPSRRDDIQTVHHVPPPLVHASLIELSIQAPPVIRNTIISSLVLPEVQYFLDRSRIRQDEWEITLDISCLRVLGNSRPFPKLISLRLGGNRSLWQPPVGPSAGPRQGGHLSFLTGALAGLPMLRALTFDQVHWGDGQYLRCLSGLCPRLEWLTFATCQGYTLKDVQSILVERRKLESMSPIKRIAICDLYNRRQDLPEWGAKEWLDGAVEFLYKPIGSEEREWDYLTNVERLI